MIIFPLGGLQLFPLSAGDFCRCAVPCIQQVSARGWNFIADFSSLFSFKKVWAIGALLVRWWCADVDGGMIAFILSFSLHFLEKNGIYICTVFLCWKLLLFKIGAFSCSQVVYGCRWRGNRFSFEWLEYCYVESFSLLLRKKRGKGEIKFEVGAFPAVW